jgi:hypothetical protein
LRCWKFSHLLLGLINWMAWSLIPWNLKIFPFNLSQQISSLENRLFCCTKADRISRSRNNFRSTASTAFYNNFSFCMLFFLIDVYPLTLIILLSLRKERHRHTQNLTTALRVKCQLGMIFQKTKLCYFVHLELLK